MEGIVTASVKFLLSFGGRGRCEGLCIRNAESCPEADRCKNAQKHHSTPLPCCSQAFSDGCGESFAALSAGDRRKIPSQVATNRLGAWWRGGKGSG